MTIRQNNSRDENYINDWNDWKLHPGFHEGVKKGCWNRRKKGQKPKTTKNRPNPSGFFTFDPYYNFTLRVSPGVGISLEKREKKVKFPGGGMVYGKSHIISQMDKTLCAIQSADDFKYLIRERILIFVIFLLLNN